MELFMFYRGEAKTCPETKQMLDIEYPGWSISTIVDVKEYLDHHKTHNIEAFALVAIYKMLTGAQRKTLAKWKKDKIKDTVFDKDEDKDKHEHVKKAHDDEKALRYGRQLLLKDGKATDKDILDKCSEVLGLLP